MQLQVFQPDVVICTVVICASGKCWMAGAALLRLVERQLQGLKPDLITDCAASNACMKVKQPDEAITSGGLQLCDLVPDVIVYSAAITAYEKAK